MTRFTITCFCKRTNIKFRSPANFGAEIIARVYCPRCSDRAPCEALLIHVEGVPGKIGIYAIDWNQGALQYLDPKFHNHEHWYENFFGKRKLIFNFIPEKTKGSLYTVHGLKEEVDLTGLSTRRSMTAETPTQWPKRARSDPRESYRPMHGGKKR
ncbi:MAG: hypothetical protein UX17_C0024G0002 [Parcubacteria group bacterium GW2011_GWC2_45_7]|nr:MAG: hypothetical protein UX17_C0024G0002 [Parcubacteria group bacterium GW2011_GWC2_45_7]KKU73438.1 MAG: hypothetical protein UX98_C0007G0014 [Parcubacteria group bacterium GW2011_GWA2_47_26]